mmetsp:Transcript_8078/g.20586  ORF Transcript_8078/g.20586 Transcript_8078/m.20586 type:complete len:86 (+) Transcript_8078:945-1202(+)
MLKQVRADWMDQVALEKHRHMFPVNSSNTCEFSRARQRSEVLAFGRTAFAWMGFFLASAIANYYFNFLFLFFSLSIFSFQPYRWS